MLRIHVKEKITGCYAIVRVGIQEEQNVPRENYKNTWEAKVKRELNFPATWLPSSALIMPIPLYDALCDDGRKYATENGLTFVCQLL